MATGNAVITGKIGPAITSTALAVADVKNFTFNLENQTLRVAYKDDPRKVQYWDIAADTTFTIVLTGTNFVLTVS